MRMEKVESQPVSAGTHRAAFFRQSGWLMMATIIGGIMSYAVHLLSKKIPNEQYSIFGTMLMVTSCLPTTPLQMMLAQQTASALATNRQRQLAGMIRLIWLGFSCSGRRRWWSFWLFKGPLWRDGA